MIERYRDSHGNTAEILVYRIGGARLEIRTATGVCIHGKEYKNRKGARIALGRRGRWERMPTQHRAQDERAT